MHNKCIQQFSDPFWVNCYFLMEENGLAPFKGGSEFDSRVNADWNYWLQISAFSLVSVVRIPLIPNAAFFQ